MDVQDSQQRIKTPIDEAAMQKVLEGIVDTIHDSQDPAGDDGGDLARWAKDLPEFEPAYPMDVAGGRKALLVKAGGSVFQLDITRVE